MADLCGDSLDISRRAGDRERPLRGEETESSPLRAKLDFSWRGDRERLRPGEEMDLSLCNKPLDLSCRLESERERLLREEELDLPRRKDVLRLSWCDNGSDLSGCMLVFIFGLESDLDLSRLRGVLDFRLGLSGETDRRLLAIGVRDFSLGRGDDPDR